MARPTGVTDEVAGVSLNEKHRIHFERLRSFTPIPLKGKAVLRRSGGSPSPCEKSLRDYVQLRCYEGGFQSVLSALKDG